MKVLMLLENNPYPQDTRVQREATTLSSAGYTVNVICPHKAGQPRYECIDGVRVYRFPSPAPGNGLLGYTWEYGYSTLAFMLISLWVFVRHGFDVIHAHNPPDVLVVVALAYKLIGKRFIFDHHDLSPEMYFARFHGKGSPKVHRVLLLLEKLSCRAATHVIATNQSYKKLEIERDGVAESRVTIVRNGPRLDQVETAPLARTPNHQGKLLIGYVGVIGYQDGVDYLLQALCHLRNDLKRSNFMCLIMGDGDALADLKKQVADLDLTDYVEFTGWVPHDRVASALRTVDICVAPEPSNDYNDRSTMIKITEYMAASKPIVAFDLPEHRYTAENAALYAQANDPYDFACKLGELMDDAARGEIMGRLGRRRMQDSLGWPHQAENLLEVYRKLSTQSDPHTV
ncbi:MAG: glycosyltransferase family 4 protein [Chloroflexota bacterium]